MYVITQNERQVMNADLIVGTACYNGVISCITCYDEQLHLAKYIDKDEALLRFNDYINALGNHENLFQFPADTARI